MWQASSYLPQTGRQPAFVCTSSLYLTCERAAPCPRQQWPMLFTPSREESVQALLEGKAAGPCPCTSLWYSEDAGHGSGSSCLSAGQKRNGKALSVPLGPGWLQPLHHLALSPGLGLALISLIGFAIRLPMGPSYMILWKVWKKYPSLP